MTDQPGPSRLHWQVLFDAALQDYETQTGIVLANHPLAEQLQNCHSVESVTAVLREQTQAFSEFRGRDKILKPLKMSYQFCINFLPPPTLVRLSAWYVCRH